MEPIVVITGSMHHGYPIKIVQKNEQFFKQIIRKVEEF